MSRKILIPVIHRPAMTSWSGERLPATLFVPHYADNVQPDAYFKLHGAHPRLSCGTGHDATLRGTTHRTDWLEAPEWTGTLRVTGYCRGRSSSCYAVSVAHDEDAARTVVGLMSCREYLHLIPRVVDCGVRGIFRAVKRGQNYLLIDATSSESAEEEEA